MPPVSTSDTAFQLLDFDRYAEHIVTHPKEVDFLLRNLLSQRTILGLFSQQRYVFPTLLIGLDEHQVFLDVSRDDALNQRIVGHDVVCQGKLDGVVTQFALRHPALQTRSVGRAFVAPRPDAILRLQRREYFRLRVPLAHNVVCKINVAPPGQVPHYLPVRVLDISNGGVAILVPPSTLKLTPGQLFADSQLIIPTSEPITVTLEVRNVFHVTNRMGQVVERAGCQFIDLPAHAYTKLQRYIFTAQRELQRTHPHE